MKRFLFLALIICLIIHSAYADGFSSNPEQINQAAKSVMMLELVDSNGNTVGSGSGFVAFDNRHLITNYHVAEHADMIYAHSDIGDPYIIMDVCIADSEKDIAILQFFSPTDLQPLPLNESGEVLRASPVIAIGSPKGFSNTISSGIISSVFEDSGCSYIQFTAPISKGSSGGALFNDNGNVIGITTMYYDDGDGISQNINFAVNIKEAIELYSQYAGTPTKLTNLTDTDINTPLPTATPKPTKAPTPTPSHKPTPTPKRDYKQYPFPITDVFYNTSIDGNTLYATFRIENNTDKDIKEFDIFMISYMSENVASPTSRIIHIEKGIKAHDFGTTLEQRIPISSKYDKFLIFSISKVTYQDGSTVDRMLSGNNFYRIDIK